MLHVVIEAGGDGAIFAGMIDTDGMPAADSAGARQAFRKREPGSAVVRCTTHGHPVAIIDPHAAVLGDGAFE